MDMLQQQRKIGEKKSYQENNDLFRQGKQHRFSSDGHLCKENSMSEEFVPEFSQARRPKKKLNQGKMRVGCWNKAENQMYLKFIADNIDDFENQVNRRKSKVFFRMSKLLKKRTPDQCRSHHQKLQLKFGDNLRHITKVTSLRIARRQSTQNNVPQFPDEDQLQLVSIQYRHQQIHPWYKFQTDPIPTVFFDFKVLAEFQ